MRHAPKVFLTTTLAATAMALPSVLALAPGAAYASSAPTTVPCGTRSTAQYFSRWGDDNQYFLSPGASFQPGTANAWTFSGGAGTVPGGDPWNVTGTSKPAAANIPPGGKVSSLTFCVDSDETAIRFFYHSPGVNGSALFLNVTVTSGSNVANNTIDIANNTAGWAVANVLDLPTIYGAKGQEDITIAFSPANTPATWQVDDVMVDPFSPL
jgi:hypothetical protein